MRLGERKGGDESSPSPAPQFRNPKTATVRIHSFEPFCTNIGWGLAFMVEGEKEYTRGYRRIRKIYRLMSCHSHRVLLSYVSAAL